jgi:hypothetical protein
MPIHRPKPSAAGSVRSSPLGPTRPLAAPEGSTRTRYPPTFQSGEGRKSDRSRCAVHTSKLPQGIGNEIKASIPRPVRWRMVPHITIRPIGRTRKRQHSKPKLRLPCVSLQAEMAHAAGFPRCRDDSAPVSATISQFPRENRLPDTRDHRIQEVHVEDQRSSCPHRAPAGRK